jgi:hypothetical protein
LADVARRLVAIDPDRAGIGGLRLQLELALLGGVARRDTAAIAVPASSPRPASPPPAAKTPEPETEATRQSAPATSPEPATTPEPEPAKTPEPEREPASPVEATTGPEPPRAPEPPTAAELVATSAPADTPPAAASATDGLTLESIVAAWPEIVGHLSQKPAIKQLILTCRPVAIDGSVVSLGFPEEQAFLRDVAERKKADIEGGIGQVVGRDVGVRCVVANVEVAPLPPADDLVAEARRIFGEDLVDVGEVS